ncbi:hypothetical protein [Empedobacter falsenii]|uniref:hypothetical protein n=1 Tax=Empedobacter falsenii TaxID=343874 RepID=UPI003A8046DA
MRTRTILSDLTIERLKNDENIIDDLRRQSDKSSYTIRRWIDSNDIQLTQFDMLKIIKKHTKLSDGELLQQVKITEDEKTNN